MSPILAIHRFIGTAPVVCFHWSSLITWQVRELTRGEPDDEIMKGSGGKDYWRRDMWNNQGVYQKHQRIMFPEKIATSYLWINGLQ